MWHLSKIFFFIFIWTSQNATGCLNYYHTIDQDGDFHEMTEYDFVGFNKNFNYKLIASKLPELEADFQNSHSPYSLSDYAVYLMKAGKVVESLALLVELNRNLPNEYQIAANLGTAYELNGELDSALFYINRGVELNPDAHGGSEWVHIKVLECKLNLIDNPTYLSNRTVLGLTDEQKEGYQTRNQLEIQIRERFPFTPGPDQIMASLMLDLGDCYATSLSIEYAKAFYVIAEEYYGADKNITRPKIEKMLELRNDYKNIEPIHTTSDGNDIKLTGVSYKSTIDDNNPYNYTIDWSKYNTDIQSLLEEVNYAVDKTIVAEDEEANQPILVNEPVQESKQNNWIPISILSGLLVLLGVTYFSIKKLSKK